MIITTTSNELNSSWAVYMLYDANAVIQYIGYCPFSKLLALPDARAKVDFDQIFGNGAPMILRLVKTCSCRASAMILQRRLIINGETPMLNYKSDLMIECIDTGEKWESATECVEAHGLTHSALSNHLNRKPSYNSIKGKKYRRISK